MEKDQRLLDLMLQERLELEFEEYARFEQECIEAEHQIMEIEKKDAILKKISDKRLKELGY